MSSISTTKDRHQQVCESAVSIPPTQDWHRQVCEFVTSTGASAFSIGVALFPVMHLLRLKSFEQTGKGRPASVWESLGVCRKAAPLLSATLCSQVVAERMIKNWIAPDFAAMSPQQKVAATAASATAVGFLTAPLLAVFNGLTMGKIPRMPTGREWLVITGREAFFVAGLTGSGPVGEWAKEHFGGENKRVNAAIEYGVTASTAAVASVLSHPFDTWLSTSQAGVLVRDLKHLMAGVKNRTAAVAALTLIYKVLNEQCQDLVSKKVVVWFDPGQEAAK